MLQIMNKKARASEIVSFKSDSTPLPRNKNISPSRVNVDITNGNIQILKLKITLFNRPNCSLGDCPSRNSFKSLLGSFVNFCTNSVLEEIAVIAYPKETEIKPMAAIKSPPMLAIM